VPALVMDSEAKLFKARYGVLMPHTGSLGDRLDGHFGFADLEELGFVRFRREPSRIASWMLARVPSGVPCEWRHATRTTHENPSSCSINVNPVFFMLQGSLCAQT